MSVIERKKVTRKENTAKKDDYWHETSADVREKVKQNSAVINGKVYFSENNGNITSEFTEEDLTTQLENLNKKWQESNDKTERHAISEEYVRLSQEYDHLLRKRKDNNFSREDDLDLSRIT